MHLVQIVEHLQVGPVAAGIRQPHTRIVPEIVLERQVPLLYRRILVVDRERHIRNVAVPGGYRFAGNGEGIR